MAEKNDVAPVHNRSSLLVKLARQKCSDPTVDNTLWIVKNIENNSVLKEDLECSFSNHGNATASHNNITPQLLLSDKKVNEEQNLTISTADGTCDQHKATITCEINKPINTESDNNIIDTQLTSLTHDNKSEEDPFSPFSSDDSLHDPDYVKESSSESEDIVAHTQLNHNNILREINTGSAENGTEKEKKKGKKRKSDPSTWRKNFAAKCRNSGKAYVSSSKSKKTFEARRLGPPCNEKCRLKCATKLSEDDRRNIFHDYWGLANLEKQRSFLLASMERITPKYRYTREGSNRSINNAFYLSVRDSKLRVCKYFFKSTLGITDRPIRTVLEKQTLFTGGMITNDMRGKHGHHCHVDENVKEGIRRHIESIPKIESHYCRSDTAREFIDGGKSLADLHRDYAKLCEENNEPSANYLMYSRIFNTEHNLSFFTPKKDQCEDCVMFANAEGNDKENLSTKYEEHLNEKELSRQEKEKDKQNVSDNFIVAVYDLQAVLQCPRGDVSTFYYTSKLNVFNFTMFELKTNSVTCFVWDESQANRGACEIGTCVLNFIEDVNNKAMTSKTQTDLVFYSDNCCGQQKNRFIFLMYLFAVQKYDFIRSITHKFLIKGHSQNEGDGVHSVIERHIKRSLKSAPIFVPSQYVSLIATAKKTGQPYQIKEMNYSSFFDLKDLAAKYGPSFPKNTENEAVKIGEFKIVRVEKEHPRSIFYKTSYSDELFSKIELRQCRSKGQHNNIVLKSLYKNKIGLAQKKKESIMSLCNKNVIPKQYADYYKNLS